MKVLDNFLKVVLNLGLTEDGLNGQNWLISIKDPEMQEM